MFLLSARPLKTERTENLNSYSEPNITSSKTYVWIISCQYYYDALTVVLPDLPAQVFNS